MFIQDKTLTTEYFSGTIHFYVREIVFHYAGKAFSPFPCIFSKKYYNKNIRSYILWRCYEVNRDRGVIKWTSLMLPEHVQLLKELAKKHEKKTAPIIDPQQYEEWNQLLMNAYHQKEKIVVTFIKDGIEEEFHGFIHRIDQLNHRLILTDEEKITKMAISFRQMVDVRIRS